jgi:uncharacterized protein YqhQ
MRRRRRRPIVKAMVSPSRPYIGGQAVLEGVMMRAPKSFAVVVRRKDGSLQVRERAMADRPRGAAQWPLLRGIASVAESFKLGGEALRFSVQNMEEDLAGAQPAPRVGSGLSILGAFGLSLFSMVTGGENAPAPAGGKGERAGMWLMLAMAVGFFVAIPQASAAGVNRVLGLGLQVQSAALQAMTGAFKLTLVVGYLLAIRRVPEIRRVFQYHGAEHKTISTYEAREALTVDAARTKTTMHPRCGTTFLVMVALVSIAVFTAIGAALPRISCGNVVLDNVLFFLEKLPFLPLIAAITFELQRVLARYCATGPLRSLLWPGFLVQKITTAEPSDDQLEVALASLRVTLFRQEHDRGCSGDEETAFASYGSLAAALEPPPR